MQARQRSVKDQLLRQVPVIGRDRLKHRGLDQAQLSASPNGFIAGGASSAALAVGGDKYSHSRSNSRGEALTGPDARV